MHIPGIPSLRGQGGLRAFNILQLCTRSMCSNRNASVAGFAPFAAAAATCGATQLRSPTLNNSRFVSFKSSSLFLERHHHGTGSSPPLAPPSPNKTIHLPCFIRCTNMFLRRKSLPCSRTQTFACRREDCASCCAFELRIALGGAQPLLACIKE